MTSSSSVVLMHGRIRSCKCAQSHALSTRTRFQPEIRTINVISGIVYFREIILGSLPNISEIIPWDILLRESFLCHKIMFLLVYFIHSGLLCFVNFKFHTLLCGQVNRLVSKKGFYKGENIIYNKGNISQTITTKALWFQHRPKVNQASGGQ